MNFLLFADDAVLISNSPQNCQRQCGAVEKFLNWSHIDAKVSKCRSLAFQSRPKFGFVDPELHLQGEMIPFIGDKEFSFLGLPIDLLLSDDKVKDTSRHVTES